MKAYEIKPSQDKTRGRYVVAARNIRNGDTIIKDSPLVLVPSVKSLPVCLKCFRTFHQESPPVCSKCGFPRCSLCEDARRVYDHDEDECRVLSRLKVRPNFRSNRVSPIYSSLSPLRLLLKLKGYPHLTESIHLLMDHVDDLKAKEEDSWNLTTNFIQKLLGLNEFTKKQIFRAMGVVKTNCVKLSSKKGSVVGMGLYPTYALFNHSCIPNAKTRKLEDGTLELVAIADIGKGEEIFTRYVTPQLGTFRRQQLLRYNWHFTCKCQRCSDPTELGSHMNSIKCTGCSGYLQPESPLNLSSDWKCSNCKVGTLTGNKASLVILNFNLYVEKSKRDVECLEALLDSKMAKMLHPNHFLIVGVLECLVQTLNRKENGLTRSDKADILKKKLGYFKRIVDVMVLVDQPSELWTKSLEKIEKEVKEYE